MKKGVIKILLVLIQQEVVASLQTKIPVTTTWECGEDSCKMTTQGRIFIMAVIHLFFCLGSGQENIDEYTHEMLKCDDYPIRSKKTLKNAQRALVEMELLSFTQGGKMEMTKKGHDWLDPLKQEKIPVFCPEYSGGRN